MGSKDRRSKAHAPWKFQIPPDLVVKSQAADIIGIILQLIRRPNGVYRACRKRKSRGALLSTSEVQWATTKFDGVWFFATALCSHNTRRSNFMEESQAMCDILPVIR